MARFTSRMPALLVAAASLAAALPARSDDARSKKQPAASKFELKGGDRVVLLGNTLFEREQKYGYWETMLTARYPDRNITFRNLGWDGDTVWAESRGIFDPPAAGYARMIEQVKGLKPTVIFLYYGSNEAFAGEAGLEPFVRQYEKLIDDLMKVSEGVRIVVLMPLRAQKISRPYFDPDPFNERLASYSSAIRDLRSRRGVRAVNLNYLHGFSTPRELVIMDYSSWLVDGMHWSQHGYEHLGTRLREELGLLQSFELVLDHSGEVETSSNVSVSDVAATEKTLTFTVAPECMPIPRSSGQLGLRIRTRVKGLKPGTWKLKIDGVHVATGDAMQWQEGQFGVIDRPMPAPEVERLRQAIIAKNELYFHSWRPQNVTYLFGFRKHEQGQNAKETAAFEKLVAEKEAEIAKLRKPVPHRYELVREK